MIGMIGIEVQSSGINKYWLTILILLTVSCGRLTPYKTPDIIFTAYSNGFAAVYAANLLSENVYTLYMGSSRVIPMSVSLSKSHNMVLFISNQKNYYNIYLLNILSHNIKQLTPDDTNYGAPSFCFNDKIVYVTYKFNDLPQIYQMNMDGSVAGLLISEPAGTTEPVCGENNKIAYISDPLGVADLKIYNTRTGISITTPVSGVSSRFSFSPDGSKIVYSKLNNNGYQALYVLDLSTMSSTVLLSQGYDAYEPSWGINNKIAFTTTKDGFSNPNIYEINPDGSGLKKLISYGDADGNPSW